MKGELNPSSMLEALADRVATEMDRRAVASFEFSLKEMTDFHKFLIDAYSTKNEAGAVASFAQLGDWRPLHEVWIALYRRLFDRAVNYIGIESEFIKTLAHTPARLLLHDGRENASVVTSGVLDLYNILVHRLENWLTQHRMFRDIGDNLTTPPIIAGSYEHAYKDVIIDIVSAWEGLLLRGELMYGASDDNQTQEDSWRRLQESWPFMQRHLDNSAYMLAAAVWNEDETGADYFCEMLARWLNGIDHLFNNYFAGDSSLITSDLLGLSWPDALQRIDTIGALREWHQLSPREIFKSIADNAWSDVKITAAGLYLAWTAEKRQQTDIGARIAARLLMLPNVDAFDELPRSEVRFRDLVIQQLRMKTAGEEHERTAYANWLDERVRALDTMTERRIVPGRSYRPSTRSSRQDLMVPWLAILAARLPPDGDDGATTAILKLTENENAFANGDKALRRWTDELERWKSVITPEIHKALFDAVKAITPDVDVEERMERLAGFIDTIIAGVKEQRLTRLRARDVSVIVLDQLRDEIEAGIRLGGHAAPFKDFVIFVDDADMQLLTLRFPDQMKGWFTEPQMDQPPINLYEYVVRGVSDFSRAHLWQDFLARPREMIDAQDEDTFAKALESAADELKRDSGRPILFVRGWESPHWVRKWFGFRSDTPEGIKVSRRGNPRPDRYIGTVNGVDVFVGNCPVGQSLLARDDLLTNFVYRKVDEKHFVSIIFAPSEDERKGALEIRFAQSTLWKDSPIYALTYEEQNEDE